MYADALKNKTLELRKAKDPMATFLIAVGSKAKDLAKAKDPHAETFGDDQALQSINSFIKGAEENIELYRGASSMNPKALERFERAVAERDMLKSFLPAEATEAEVRAEIDEYIANAEGMVGNRMKLMGPIMAHLNTKFGAALNKSEASALVKSVLNS